MASKLSESAIEQTALAWLEAQGYVVMRNCFRRDGSSGLHS
jgi:hypothetical protein